MDIVMIIGKNSTLGYLRNDVSWRHSLRTDYISTTNFDPRCVLFGVGLCAQDRYLNSRSLQSWLNRFAAGTFYSSPLGRQSQA